MATPEHYARKEELIKEISETRELIKNLTQQLRPYIDELEALKDYEILEISDNWLESRETIDAVLDRAWDSGRGNRLAAELIDAHVQSIKPQGVEMWYESGHYEVKGHDVRVIGLYIGLNYHTSKDHFEEIAQSIRTICSTIGSTGDDYYFQIMDDNSNASYALYPSTNTVGYHSWGAVATEFEGKSLEDALEYISKYRPYTSMGEGRTKW